MNTGCARRWGEASRRWLLLACHLWLLVAGSASASVVVGGTRVVFPDHEREVTLRVRNEGVTPSLVQVWLDTGNDRSAPGDVEVPFVVLPPLFRLDPKASQAMRIMHTGEALAKDRETLYWVNVLEVPPRPAGSEADKNYFQLAYRTRIKLFFRPPGLPGQALGAWEKVQWRLVRTHEGKWALEGQNPTPFHVNYGSMVLASEGRSHTVGGGYIAPLDRAQFVLPDDVGAWRSLTLTYGAINDHGGMVQGNAVVPVGN